ncbi:hypothetical protein CEB3_c21320 [Peptococcaceae bacterium CEB3]|nr:hypothetical protein CEB3_c21320 [Peptococcaceae bacterium CEB3]
MHMQVTALEAMKLPLGALVRVEPRGKEGDTKSFIGIVESQNKRFFTVRGRYCQSYLKIDLVLGLILLTDPGKSRKRKEAV